VPDREPKARHPFLAVAAYVLVPGERRARAMGHFRRAGVEALRGLGALATPAQRTGTGEGPRREHIDIE
jgi:hypothetical protein